MKRRPELSSYRAWILSPLALTMASLMGSIVVVSARVQTPQSAADREHAQVFLENRYPSATTCAACHAEIYREWSVSAHAYAQLSPVFNAMQARTVKLTNGTNGDFCIRCHTQVGMNLGEPVYISNLDRNPTSREGITCVVCHRQTRAYGKLSGRLPLEQGGLYANIYGPTGGDELKRALASGEYNLQTDPTKPGRGVHGDVVRFDALPKPGFCGACHDVNLVNGFRLEEAFSDYKTSPAAKKGTTCNDCHMGTEPGRPSGYRTGPAARVGDRDTRPRKRTSHMFAGPDYSIVHPGIFPHNTDAQALATLQEWLTFDYKAGWGTDAFEKGPTVSSMKFPDRWKEPDDRYDAASIIRKNQALLDEIAVERLKLLRVGYQLGKVDVEKASENGIKFKVEFVNGTEGHNVPTGFDAERVVWLHVKVVDSRGRTVFQSGDLDPNGDVRDSHSVYVHDGELPLDKFLFTLQSRFITRMVRGGEREQVLPVAYSPDPLPFLRPSTNATVLTGRPGGARKHRMTIPPLKGFWSTYEVSRSELAGSVGPYHATVQIKAGMVPPNLIQEIASVGFDYGMSPRAVSDAVVAGQITVWNRDVPLVAGGGK